MSNKHISISLDTELNQALIQEGLAREIVSQIQKTRKELNLEVDQRIQLVVSAEQETIDIFDTHQDYILNEVLALSWQQYSSIQNHTFEHVNGSFSIVIHEPGDNELSK